MAKSFLTAVNDALKRVGEIAGAAGALTTFTDSQRQHKIDVMIQAWNDVLHEALSTGEYSTEIAEGSITLATSTREYAVESDFIAMSDGLMVNETDGYDLPEYPGGFEQMRRDQLQPGNYDGQPHYWAINPVTGEFRMDREPTANENGDVYKYLYNKRVALSAIADTFPVNDTAVDAMTPAVVEIYSRHLKKSFDRDIFQASLARAVRHMRQEPPREKYGRQGH